MQQKSLPDSGNNPEYNLVLDAGTTGIKAIIFDEYKKVVARSYKRIGKVVDGPKVEQDPFEILNSSIEMLKEVMDKSGLDPGSIKSLSITNQRETTILWNPKDGKPVYPAIVWEDTRTENYCEGLRTRNEEVVRRKTGLTLDPYFSASKINWIINNVPSARDLYEKNSLFFGTIDTWLLWNLARGNPHRTDYTNASRTLIFNILDKKWDDELLNIFSISPRLLPEVVPSKYIFGNLNSDIFGYEIPILAMCGDQQASMFAAGTSPGDTKTTFGTGTFIMQILNDFQTVEGFFTTLASGISGEPIFALESKIQIGSKDADPIIGNVPEMEKFLRALGKKVASHILRLPQSPKVLIIDGGITQADNIEKIMQEEIGVEVKKQIVFDGTALGAAMLAK